MTSKKKTRAPARIKNDTEVITGVVRLSYVHLFEPWAGDNGKLKYSTAILIDKNDESTLSCIKQAVENAIEKGKSKLAANGKTPKNLKTPLNDGDAKHPDKEEYEGMFFLNASNEARPEIIERDFVDGEPVRIREPYDDDGEPTVYSGCYARVKLNFYPFNTNGNRGVACSLKAVQKWKDGEALDGSSGSAKDFFEDDDEDETPKRVKKPSRYEDDDADDDDDPPKRVKKPSRYEDDDEDETPKRAKKPSRRSYDGDDDEEL